MLTIYASYCLSVTCKNALCRFATDWPVHKPLWLTKLPAGFVHKLFLGLPALTKNAYICNKYRTKMKKNHYLHLLMLALLVFAAPSLLRAGDKKAVAAGYQFCLVLKQDGSLWAFGRNDDGQLGDGTTQFRSEPVKVLDHVRQMSAGLFFSMALLEDGTLWTWGYNNNGQLGDGTNTSRLRPQKIMDGISDIAAGFAHALAVGNDGTLWAWGWNGWGQLGDGSDVDRNVPVRVMTGVRQASADSNCTAAVKTDGSLWVWGDDVSGKSIMEPPVKMLDGVRQVSVGGRHILAVMADGRLLAWGWNENGQLGDGTTTDRLTPVKIMTGVKEVSGGDGAALILCEDGSLYETGIYFKPSAPRKIKDGVRKVSCLGSNMVLRNDGTLWMWGSNIHGQLGDGTTNSIYSAKEAVQVMSGVKDISNGRQHSMAICEDGSLWAWGGNRYSQLGDGTTTDRLRPVRIEGNVRSVSCGFTVSAWITADGELRMVGKPL